MENFTLAVLFPAWLKHVYKQNIARVQQFAARVWDVECCPSNPKLTKADIITILNLAADS